MSPSIKNLLMIRNRGNFKYTLKYVGSGETISTQEGHGEENVAGLPLF